MIGKYMEASICYLGIFSGGTEESHENSQSEQPVFGLRYESETFRIQSKSPNHMTAKFRLSSLDPCNFLRSVKYSYLYQTDGIKCKVPVSLRRSILLDSRKSVLAKLKCYETQPKSKLEKCIFNRNLNEQVGHLHIDMERIKSLIPTAVLSYNDGQYKQVRQQNQLSKRCELAH